MAKVDISSEWPRIVDCAQKYGVDPFFLAAVRVAESGRAGREFGVLVPKMNTYDLQLRTACATFRRHLHTFVTNPFDILKSDAGINRLIYRENFVRTVASSWAPIGATNDPTNLNVNWFTNVWTYYRKFVVKGAPT